MKTIFCFTDGSSYSASVYGHTAWAAQRLGAQARVIHTLNPHRETTTQGDLSGSIGFNAQQSLLDEIVASDAARARLAQKKGEAILADARERLREAGLEGVQAEQRHGLFVDVLEDLGNQADLIVLGKRGTNASRDMKHLGTNIERALRVARCPALVASREFKPIQKFLIAFDGGPSARKAVDYVAAQPLLSGCQCHLLRVGSETPAHRKELESAAAQLAAAGFDPVISLKDGAPAKVIAAEVESGGVGLLVMGAYGHSKYKQLLIGSTTAALVRDCHVPILMFR